MKKLLFIICLSSISFTVSSQILSHERDKFGKDESPKTERMLYDIPNKDYPYKVIENKDKKRTEYYVINENKTLTLVGYKNYGEKFYMWKIDYLYIEQLPKLK